MEFSQAIFVNGLIRKLKVSTPVVLCFISVHSDQSLNKNSKTRLELLNFPVLHILPYN